MTDSFMANRWALFFLTVFATFVVLSVSAVREADAATYYVAPNGSDGSAGTSSAPWATFSKAMKILKPGDTLLIEDGTYYQSLNVKVSGTTGSPITIKAVNDGAAIIDGQNTLRPINIQGTSGAHKHDITIEGIVAKNSNNAVITVSYVDRLIMKRVSAYQTADGNYHPFSLQNVTYSLIEECSAGGRGRAMYDILDSSYITVRRCWGRPEGVTYDLVASGIQIYGSSNCIVENNVIVKNLASTTKTMRGISIWTHYYNAPSNNNKIMGNVARYANNKSFASESSTKNTTGSIFKDNVAMDTNECMRHAADDNLTVENFTCVNSSVYHYRIKSSYDDPTYTLDSNFSIGGTLKNSSFLNSGTGIYRDTNDPKYAGLTHTYNNFYNLSTLYSGASSGRGETCNSLNPNYDTAAYGKGAYIMVPAVLKGKGEGGANIGAEVLYRYQDGVLTSTPLWPWPMEDRIYRETGISVTWESKGGLWKTLNGVYK